MLLCAAPRPHPRVRDPPRESDGTLGPWTASRPGPGGARRRAAPEEAASEARHPRVSHGGRNALCEQYIASGYAVIGDPDEAIARIEQLRLQSGGFGSLLLLAHNWPDWAETRRSDELVARYVMPRFRGDNAGRQGSMEWAAANRTDLMEAGRLAKVEAARKHDRERAGRPEP
jgi:hypothetical protein